MRQKGFIDPKGFLLFMALIFLSGVASALVLPHALQYAIKQMFYFFGSP